MAGPGRSAAEGGPVAALRGDGSLAREVSSVDNADRGTGRVAVVLALSQEAAGRAGQYGAGGGASGPLPTPAP